MSRKARARVIYRRFVRKFVRTITRVESRVPSKSLGRPGDSGAAASVQIRRAARPAMSSFSGRLSHPKPEGRQRSQIGRARSATARFFGRVTVPSAVTSAAPGAWRIAWDGAAAVSILRLLDHLVACPQQRPRRNREPARKSGLRPLCTGSVDALVSHHAHQCARSFPPVAEQARS